MGAAKHIALIYQQIQRLCGVHHPIIGIGCGSYSFFLRHNMLCGLGKGVLGKIPPENTHRQKVCQKNSQHR